MMINLICGTLSAQDYLGETKDEIINKFKEKESDNSKYKISFIDSTIHSDTNDHLTVLIDGYEKIELEYFFDDFDNLCDSITMKYHCCEWADKHIKDFLSEKGRKWKLIGTDEYISRRRTTKLIRNNIVTVGSPKMMIQKKSNDAVCATIYFSIPMMPKEEWKNLIKK